MPFVAVTLSKPIRRLHPYIDSALIAQVAGYSNLACGFAGQLKPRFLLGYALCEHSIQQFHCCLDIMKVRPLLAAP